MKSYPACLLLFSTVAFADCEKIDYVEVKDWPVAKVEQAYCVANAEKWQVWRQGTMIDMWLPDGTPTARGYKYEAALKVCHAQLALYARVLENIHKRAIPSCK